MADAEGQRPNERVVIVIDDSDESDEEPATDRRRSPTVPTVGATRRATRASLGSAPWHAWLGKRVSAWRKAMGAFEEGEVVDVHEWHGRQEPKVRFERDGKTFWVDSWRWPTAQRTSSESTQAVSGSEVEAAAATSSTANAAADEWPFPVLVEPVLLNGEVESDLVQGPPKRPRRERRVERRRARLELLGASSPAPVVQVHERPSAAPSKRKAEAAARCDTTCMVPGCSEGAFKPHPLVTGMRVCSRHHELIERVPKLRRSPCTDLPMGSELVCCPQRKLGWVCNSLGCQVGLERPCILCGEGNDGVLSDGSGGGSSSGGGGGGRSGGDGDGGCGRGELTLCTKPGCSASLHMSCRRLLARRVKVWWDGDEKWYWGTAQVTRGPILSWTPSLMSNLVAMLTLTPARAPTLTPTLGPTLTPGGGCGRGGQVQGCLR